MTTLQFYKNPYNYPYYGGITAVGSSMPSTPVGTGLKGGTIRVAGDMAKFMDCNYLSINTDGKTIYGWIEDVSFRSNTNYDVTYRVDPWRTYRAKINLGVQFVERSSKVTHKQDDLLGADSDIVDVESLEFRKGTRYRYLIVQLRDHPETGTGNISNTPVQPTPYRFMVRRYDPINWHDDLTIRSLLSTLANEAETNILTIYSVPYVDTAALGDDKSFRITQPDGTLITSQTGFKDFMPSGNNYDALVDKVTINPTLIDVDELERKAGNVKLVIPGAGVVNLPLEILRRGSVKIRRDVDVFSGASNFMIEADGELFDLSVRGSGISSIPVLSDPMDTYLSQNQNALATSLIGDVATIAGGAGMAVASGGAGAVAGGAMVTSGITSIINKRASTLDSANRNNSPAAMLGTALDGAFHDVYWLIITKKRVDNEGVVHSNFGYPLEKVTNLTFPSSGYVKTQGCAVTSDGTVPLWAIQEINNMFDTGIYVN